MLFLVIIMVAPFLVSGCAIAPLISFVGAAYQGYTVWKGSEATKYFNHDLETTYQAVKQSATQMKLGTSTLPPLGMGYALETNGENPLQINVLPVEKNVTKVTIRISLLGDKQFTEYFYKTVEDNLAKKALSVKDKTPIATEMNVPANKIFHGLCFGSYIMSGQMNGDAISEEQLRELVKKVAPYTKWLRTYSVANNFSKIPEMARQQDPSLKVAAGTWLTKHNTRTAPSGNEEIRNLVDLAKAGKIDIAIVGNEATKNGVSPGKLISYITYVKDQLKGLPVQVTSGLSWKEANDVRIVNACDVVFVHIYPCFMPVSVDMAVGSMNSAYMQLKDLYKGKEIIIGETGWPSEGGSNGPAVYDLASAVKYRQEIRKWSIAEGVKYFYFEAFDEPWEGSKATKFGVWDSNLTPKAGMVQ
jgi:glucan 1,3-beta-glucosidase